LKTAHFGRLAILLSEQQQQEHIRWVKNTIEVSFITDRMFLDIRCTQSKNAVKFLIFNFYTSFDREFQGDQEYVCLVFSWTFFLVEKLKKLRRCLKQIIWQLFRDSSFLEVCYEIESSNLVFLKDHRKLNKNLVLNYFWNKALVRKIISQDPCSKTGS
jgi:hypothetical protein